MSIFKRKKYDQIFGTLRIPKAKIDAKTFHPQISFHMKILKFSSYFHHAKNKAKTNELKATLNNNFLRAIQK